MGIQDLGAIGEAIGALAVIATLFYLAVQIRQSNTLARSQARQTLIDTWSAADWDIARDPRLLGLLEEGLANWPDLPDDRKTAFDLMMGRYLANLQNGVLLHASGILDQRTLDNTANYLLMCILAPGGARWWQETTRPWPEVKNYIETRLADPETLPTGVHESMPYVIRAHPSQGPPET